MMINTNLHTAAPGFKGFLMADSEELVNATRPFLKGAAKDIRMESNFYTLRTENQFDKTNKETVDNLNAFRHSDFDTTNKETVANLKAFHQLMQKGGTVQFFQVNPW